MKFPKKAIPKKEITTILKKRFNEIPNWDGQEE